MNARIGKSQLQPMLVSLGMTWKIPFPAMINAGKRQFEAFVIIIPLPLPCKFPIVPSRMMLQNESMGRGTMPLVAVVSIKVSLVSRIDVHPCWFRVCLRECMTHQNTTTDKHDVTILYNLVGGLEHFSIYWEESSQLTNIFQRGWNHQPANGKSVVRHIGKKHTLWFFNIAMGTIAHRNRWFTWVYRS